MAINVSFGGATIFKPGSYSKTTIDVGGGFPIGPAGLVVLIGEADAGIPGSAEADIRNNRFGADQLPEIRSKYRTGPIVDAANFLFAPGSDSAISGGAQTLWIYKTNASVAATKALATSAGTVTALESGIGGNRVWVSSVLTAETAPTTTGTTVTFAAASGSLLISENGVAKTVVLPAGATGATGGDFVATAQAAFISGGSTVVVTASAGTSGTVTLKLPVSATANQNGFGKSLEIIGSTGATNLGIAPALVISAVEPTATLKLDNKRDLVTEEDTVGGNVVLEVGYNGADATATVTVNATNVILTSASATITLPKSAYATLKDISDDIDARADWSSVVSSSVYYGLSPEVLDQVVVGAKSPAGKPARLKKDSAEVQAFFAASQIASLVSPAVKGLPDALVAVPLTGGARGATSSASIVTALDKFTKFYVNFIVPLFSRDADDDKSDSLTDTASDYTIAAVHQAVKTHISLMKTIKKKSERQGFLSLKDTFDNCKEAAGVLGDGRCQLVIQDIRQVDSLGNIKWFQPWALAALLAGARSGSAIGEPMTFKYLNLSGIRQTAQPMSTAEVNIVQDFDPDTMCDEAIEAGITFMEARQTGGFRVVVDNTTYGRDGNFVWNRANVIYAADIIAINLRQGLEDVYVGRKNTVTTAEIAGTAASILGQFRGAGLTVQTPDAPAGFKNLSVRMDGNTIYVSVIVKIVEGIDFILSDITIQRAQQ